MNALYAVRVILRNAFALLELFSSMLLELFSSMLLELFSSMRPTLVQLFSSMRPTLVQLFSSMLCALLELFSSMRRENNRATFACGLRITERATLRPENN
jgi:hypothetical protein